MNIEMVNKFIEKNEEQIDIMNDDALLLDEEIEKTMDLRQIQEQIEKTMQLDFSGDLNE